MDLEYLMVLLTQPDKLVQVLKKEMLMTLMKLMFKKMINHQLTYKLIPSLREITKKHKVEWRNKDQ